MALVGAAPSFWNSDSCAFADVFLLIMGGVIIQVWHDLEHVDEHDRDKDDHDKATESQQFWI